MPRTSTSLCLTSSLILALAGFKYCLGSNSDGNSTRCFLTEPVIANLRSESMLMLVAAFAAGLGGWKGEEERALSALHGIYASAVAEGYRFFSFGDAMFIHR